MVPYLEAKSIYVELKSGVLTQVEKLIVRVQEKLKSRVELLVHQKGEIIRGRWIKK